jgi:hypothetical protein
MTQDRWDGQIGRYRRGVGASERDNGFLTLIVTISHSG